MTLIPVTRIEASVDWSTKAGASAWIGADMSLPIGPRSSIGSPITWLTRPVMLLVGLDALGVAGAAAFGTALLRGLVSAAVAMSFFLAFNLVRAPRRPK